MRKYFPYEYVNSVYSLDYDKLYQKGFKGLIFDIDNTLVHHGDDSNPQIEKFLKSLIVKGFKILLFSDNDEQRVKRFIKNLDVLYICDANKPYSKNYKKAIEMLGISRKNILYIGDQIFTDIVGANNVGIPNVLVKYIVVDSNEPIGIKRHIEKIILFLYKYTKYNHRLKGVSMDKHVRRNFCDINPLFFKISTQKEIIKRLIKNTINYKLFARTYLNKELPVVVSERSSNIIKVGPGIDPVLQRNKAVNIELASSKLNHLLIRPNEVFSFWVTIGNTTVKKGYKDGRIIEKNKLKPGIGGGLCNLSNTLHLMFLDTPLEIVEFHKHSDALAPEHGKRVPFSSGTSVSYNYIDYRVKNTTNQDIQIVAYCKDDILYMKLLSNKEFKYRYELEEEDHHFSLEKGKYYRFSKIYRLTFDKETNECVNKELILDNRSEVMYDYDLIPKELIR